MNERLVVLTATGSGERLDKTLAERLPELSRAQCQRLIKEGHVTIKGKPAKGSYRPQRGERVSVLIPAPIETELIAEEIALDIRYEDEDLLVVNKPAGMVVHPGPGHPQGTLVNAVLAHCPELVGVGGERRPGIVHRLDKETSGLIVVAKHDQALRYLQGQFKRRQVSKVYQALVDGQFRQAVALIDAPIGRDLRDRKRMAVIRPGSPGRSRDARTRLKLLGYYSDYTLLECRPITGRTHQIRVHLAFAGYPIVGDTIYGRRKQRLALDRHFLHATELHFRRLFDRQPITVQAPLPEALSLLLDRLEALS